MDVPKPMTTGSKDQRKSFLKESSSIALEAAGLVIRDDEPIYVEVRELENEQEDLLRRKYGGDLRCKRPLLYQGQLKKYFDSGDWQLHKEGKVALDGLSITANIENLPKIYL